ncbi:MAG: hypothetical protein K2Q10_07280 [Rhodospirillales bacterium]|nr:hypothetical protein [Rhodospirillales bacterium]
MKKEKVTSRKRQLFCWFLVLFGAATLGSGLYAAYSGVPRKQMEMEYADLRLGMHMFEVIYVKGNPEYVLGEFETEGEWKYFQPLIAVRDLDNGKSIEDFFQWFFLLSPHGGDTRVDVRFDKNTKRLVEVGCYSTVVPRCPLLRNIRIGATEEEITAQLGKPAFEGFQGSSKRMEYEHLGMWFNLAKKRVYMYGIQDGR